MNRMWRNVLAGAAFCAVAAAPIATSAQKDTKSDSPSVALWELPKDASAITVIAIGQPQPQTLAVTPDTVISGICMDCMLPLKFKASEAAKKCAVCGCAVTNAACIVGKEVKPATWSQTLQGLAYGTVLHPTYNEADKPESGVKAITVDRKAVLLPVDGLSSQTPEKLAALVQPVGGTKVALLDGGTRLSFAVKDWTPAKVTKLEKAITEAGGKIVRAEAPAAK